ncbi:MAG: hypothetical protein K2J07_03690 [Muribaculaceae bacterium]|nr:hypothetical protein [Muribaculaceae bacterium]MDE6831817.1 hypothetical protein [Muribaculaceae bacterium]
MKPITLSPTILARESGYLAACLLTALGANIYAVIHFHRPAVELFSQLGFVVVITIALYIYILILRLIFHGVKLAWSKMRKPHK